MMKHIEEDGLFVIKYHLMIDGEPVLVKLRAGMVEESSGTRMVVGVNRIVD